MVLCCCFHSSHLPVVTDCLAGSFSKSYWSSVIVIKVEITRTAAYIFTELYLLQNYCYSVLH